MKAVIFDAFGTLFKVEQSGSARRVMAHIAEHGSTVDEDAFIAEWRDFYKQHTTPESPFYTEREIFIMRIRMFYERYGIDRSAQADVDDMLADAFTRSVYEEVPSVLTELKERYTVLIGSNTDNDVLHSVMRVNGVSVHGVYTSENLRCYKPDPEFFRRILVDNDLQPQDVIFVGDNPKDDIFGPKQLGIKTVLLDRHGKHGELGQDYTIKDLNGIMEVLKCN